MAFPEIIYFQHCSRNIFALNCPSACPICLKTLDSIVFISLPYPFHQAKEFPGSVIIKPTDGDFLNNYMECSDLHIAVTTSTGNIVEYDANGLRRSNSSAWKQCIIILQVDEIWHESWDSELTTYFSKNDWTAAAYNELSYNCYSFVMSFLKLLGIPNLSTALENKNKFCEKLIIPKTKSAIKYISIYRRLKDQEYVV